MVRSRGNFPCRRPTGSGTSGDARQAVLSVRLDAAASRAEFERRHRAEVREERLNLEQLFPLLVGRRAR